MSTVKRKKRKLREPVWIRGWAFTPIIDMAILGRMDTDEARRFVMFCRRYVRRFRMMVRA